MTRIKGVVIAVVVIASIISVAGYAILTGYFSQAFYIGALPKQTASPYQFSMEINSTYAFQDPHNSRQVSALAIAVQQYGIGSTDFTCGDINISLVTPTASYTNVYNISDFVNASTFNNTYGTNFTRYQVVAPNCSIIELNGNGNQILEQGEQFAVFLNLGQLNCTLQPYDQITVTVIPSFGAALACTYSIPADITPVTVLSGS